MTPARIAAALAALLLTLGALPARADAVRAVRAAAADPGVVARAPWAPQDPADSLYRVAREAMGRGEYKRAAELFGRIPDKWPSSAYAGDAAYYQAFSLYRAGGTAELRAAREALRPLRQRGTAAYRGDAASLDTRICGELARRGDERCAAEVAARADSADLGAVISSAVSAAVQAAGAAMNSAEVRAAIADANAAAIEGVRGASETLRSPEVQRSIAAASAEAGRAASGAVREAARATNDAIREAARELEREASRLDRGAARRRDPACASEEEDERVIALNALMQVDAERAMPVLKKVLARRDQCSEVLRRKAVFIVARTKSPEAADLLLATARTDPDPDVREQAVFWLSRVDGDRAVDLLSDVARRDTSVALRKRAVFSLAQSGSPRAKQVLRQIVTQRDGDAEVRSEALYWLAARGSAEDVEWVRAQYATLDTPELRERAIGVLGRRKGNASWLLGIARDPKEPLAVRREALLSASRAGATVEELGDVWRATTDREIRQQIIYAYSQRVNEPAAVEQLIAIARSDADRELRKTAVYWLSRSKDPRALAYLQELIDK